MKFFEKKILRGKHNLTSFLNTSVSSALCEHLFFDANNWNEKEEEVWYLRGDGRHTNSCGSAPLCFTLHLENHLEHLKVVNKGQRQQIFQVIIPTSKVIRKVPFGWFQY